MGSLTLTHLTYAGAGLPTASVEFDPTFTVIYGSSNTGKTFIVDSIDYMLGGHVRPYIPRAEGYGQILLGLLLPDGSPLTLVRKPGGKSIHVHQADLRGMVHDTPDAVVSARRIRSRRDISHYLLSKVGLDDRYIRTNESGNTELLKLADLTHLSVVTDTRMIDPNPPSQRTRGTAARTAARSVMKLMLTGEDEPPATTLPNASQRRVQRGKINLIDSLALDLHAKLSRDQSPAELREQLALLEGTLEDMARSLARESEQQARAVAARAQLAQTDAELETRLGEVLDLLGRFDILRQQYESDLARLEMVSEAGNLLGYFQVGRCVFCGADPEHQHAQHGNQETTQLHEAVVVESTKTHSLLADLLLTLSDLEAQRDELIERRNALTRQAGEADSVLAQIEARLAPLNEELQAVVAERLRVERDLELRARIDELDEHRSELVSQGALPSKRVEAFIAGRILTSFDGVLQSTLDSWRIPNVEAAGFDPYGGDVSAGGTTRAGHGRGMRALLHAAFSIALARYCLDRRLPHLGFLVLDSPLVTYKEPDYDADRIPPNVIDHFYRSILAFPGQAIVVENAPPPPDVLEHARIITFSGSGDRPGFFPARPTSVLARP
ncbi:ATP-binding protein [Streptomyces roseifaciens]|uniref:ATP-binding protein n=1 Tax=Streptomyces roseifaciens TaxID=1488406 RepID=UPI0007180C51|nr:ATP-binding protein [Streptomyces roseifaciens]